MHSSLLTRYIRLYSGTEGRNELIIGTRKKGLREERGERKLVVKSVVHGSRENIWVTKTCFSLFCYSLFARIFNSSRVRVEFLEPVKRGPGKVLLVTFRSKKKDTFDHHPSVVFLLSNLFSSNTTLFKERCPFNNFFSSIRISLPSPT